MTIDLEALYIDLHQHPELSFQETRTAGIAAGHLRDLGLEVHEGVGITGVVGVLDNGDGPVVWVRADMDALPVGELTGLPYASTATGIDPAGNTVPVMHACGHDMHVTAMIGAVERLVADREQWAGTLVVLIQPAEEYGAGSRAMLDGGLLDLVPQPDIVLGQHVTPLPAGTIGVRPGTQMAASDGLTVVLHGRGGHGSRPHSTIDPVVMAAAGIDWRSSVPFLDVNEVRERLLRVPLIAQASVRKIYPNEIAITQVEREPAALWQKNGEISVIAADGTVIDAMRDDRYASLPLVVGDDANTKLPEYLALIAAAGPLAERIKAGTYVSGRRWTLKFDGIDVRLPEADPAAALARLVRFEREAGLLEKDIIAVDLRMPDRLVVRLTEEAAAARAEAQKAKKKGAAS